MPIRVFIYDDSAERCDSLRALLGVMPDFACVGTAHHCGAVDQDMASSQPDVVLMDVHMPVHDGLAGLRRIQEAFPRIKVLMQTISEDEATVFEALKAGALGYVLKRDSPLRLLEAIREVQAGGAVMSPSVALNVAQYFRRSETTQWDGLTPREQAVLRLLSEGKSYKMIAADLGIGYSTVNAHLKNIYDKLGVHSAGEAIALALKNQWC